MLAAVGRRAAILAAAAGGSLTLPSATEALVPPLAFPPIGLGTCCDTYDAARAAILSGLGQGYRLLDTAAHYDSEPAVGDALEEARKRGILAAGDDVQIVTKVWFDDMGYEATLASAQRSLANLRAERLDTLLVHFPGSVDAVQSPSKNRKLRSDTWRALETLLADGKCRAIGVSNYSRRHLKETLASCAVPPQVLQLEAHPRLPQLELVEYARSSGVGTIMAHCPLAHGSRALLDDPSLGRVAAARGPGVTPAMICLRWSLDRGLVPIPKASSDLRLRENLAAAKLAPLSAEERAAVDALEAFGPDARVSFDPNLIA